MLQQWRAAGKLVLDVTGPEIELNLPTAPDDRRVYQGRTHTFSNKVFE